MKIKLDDIGAILILIGMIVIIISVFGLIWSNLTTFWLKCIISGIVTFLVGGAMIEIFNKTK